MPDPVAPARFELPAVKGPRSVLLVCDFNAHGGTQTQVLEILAGIDRVRFRPLLATLNLHADLEERISKLGLTATNLGLRAALSVHTYQSLRGLAELIAREQVSLVHGFLLQGNIAAAVAARKAGVPYMTSVRNLELWKKPHHVAASVWAHRGARAVTFNSRHVRDLVSYREGIPEDRTRVIYNGLSPREGGAARVAGWSDRPRPRLVCVASLTPKKGHRYLLRAFARISDRHAGASLLVVGEGPERRELEREAGEKGLQERVVFCGYRADARALIADADLILLSSIEEGMPNVLIEAMAEGVPQVATSAGGTPETTVDGSTGYLVPPRDPVLMADRACRILDDPALRERMSAASRARFGERFSSRRMVRDHEAEYGAALEPAA